MEIVGNVSGFFNGITCVSDESKWDRLSPRGIEMLRLENDPQAIGHPEEQVHAHLKQLACPAYRPFVDYLLRYAGLVFNVGRHGEESCERYRLSSLRDSEVVAFDARARDWLLDIGGWVDAQFQTTMGPSGAVDVWSRPHFAHPSEPARRREASNIETYLDRCALRHWVRTNDFPSDGLPTSHPDAARRIAEAYGLQPVVEASDDVGGWWEGRSFVLATEPLQLPFGTRFSLEIYWVEKDPEIERDLDGLIIGFLEPHLAPSRTVPEFYEYRRTGNEDIYWERAVTPAELPSASFRTFSRHRLARCYETGQIDIAPPEEDGALQDYLRQNLVRWQNQGQLEPAYYAAAGLLAFGHKGYFAVMLNAMPRDALSAWPQPLWAAKYFRFLLFSLPFCPVQETAKALAWWDDNLSRLRWSEEEGKYTMV